MLKFGDFKTIDQQTNKTNVMKILWKWRHDFMINNPILTSYIAFAKGIILTVLFYEFIVN